jgi:glyoxylase-like metal-dependent hydrolase (beta-lactamase superfamily II)
MKRDRSSARGIEAMPVKEVVPGLWEISLSFVNAFLFDTGSGLALIDTGIPGSAPKILEAVRAIGREPRDIRHIFVTHCHSDHAGSLAEIKRLTHAPATMHPADAELVRAGKAMRPLTQTPGLLNSFICRFFIGSAPTEIEPAEIEIEVEDCARLPGGMQAIHVPGHCAGQLAFLWDQSGVLIAADAAAHAMGLALSPMYEDLAEGKRSLAKLSALDFDVACFGHGRPILSAASAQFQKKWPPVRNPTAQMA